MNTTNPLSSTTTATTTEQTVHSEQDLEEGGLYVVRKGKLVLVPRNDEEGMRRLRVTEEAYQKAMDIGHQMRRELGGYKPDVSLVVSALLLSDIDELRARQTVRQFVLRMFSGMTNDEEEVQQRQEEGARTDDIHPVSTEENPTR